jgi:hypothetical protein
MLPQPRLVCYAPEPPCVGISWKDQRSNGGVPKNVLMSVLFVSAVHNVRAEELCSSQKQSRADFVF